MMCFHKAAIIPLNFINRYDFVIVSQYVSCEVRPESSYVIQVNLELLERACIKLIFKSKSVVRRFNEDRFICDFGARNRESSRHFMTVKQMAGIIVSCEALTANMADDVWRLLKIECNE
jgi:hypothetical protein